MSERYKRAVDLVELTGLLQASQLGVTVEQIARRFEVSRRTAERMLAALRSRFPGLAFERREGRKYWRLPEASQTAVNDAPTGISQPLTSGLCAPLAELVEAAHRTVNTDFDKATALEQVAKLAERVSGIARRKLESAASPGPVGSDSGTTRTMTGYQTAEPCVAMAGSSTEHAGMDFE